MLTFLLLILFLPSTATLLLGLVILLPKYQAVKQELEKDDSFKEEEYRNSIMLFFIFLSQLATPLIYCYIFFTLAFILPGFDYAEENELEDVATGAVLAVSLAGAGSALGAVIILSKISDPVFLGPWKITRPGSSNTEDKTTKKTGSLGPSLANQYILFLGVAHLPAVLGLITAILLAKNGGLDDVTPIITITQEMKDAAKFIGILMGLTGFAGGTLSGFLMMNGLDELRKGEELEREAPIPLSQFQELIMKGAAGAGISLIGFVFGFVYMTSAGLL